MIGVRTALLFLACMSVTAPLRAQSEEPAVLAVVQRLFDGMRERDTAKMRSTLHEHARLVSPSGTAGSFTLSVVTTDAWLEQVGRAKGAVLDERISNPVVRVDGYLASVWVDYTFYLGDRFLHCGVDAFHLVRTPAGWRIVDLADTRRKEGCPASPS